MTKNGRSFKQKFLSLSAILLLVITGPNSHAASDCSAIVETCESLMQAADEMIAIQDKQIQELKILHGKMVGHIADQDAEISKLRNPAWYNSPLNALLIGVIIGGIGGAYINHGR